MTKIFISYRWAGAEGEAGRIYDRLTRAFGEGIVFFDTRATKPAESIYDVIKDNIQNCVVFLIIIDRQWISITEEKDGKLTRKIDNPADSVRVEIETALQRKPERPHIIPVPVGGAQYPEKDSLPVSIRDAFSLKGTDIRHDKFDVDTQILIDRIAELGVARRHPQTVSWRLLTIPIVAILLVVLGVLAFIPSGTSLPSITPSPIITMTPAPKQITGIMDTTGCANNPESPTDLMKSIASDPILSRQISFEKANEKLSDTNLSDYLNKSDLILWWDCQTSPTSMNMRITPTRQSLTGVVELSQLAYSEDDTDIAFLLISALAEYLHKDYCTAADAFYDLTKKVSDKTTVSFMWANSLLFAGYYVEATATYQTIVLPESNPVTQDAQIFSQPDRSMVSLNKGVAKLNSALKMGLKDTLPIEPTCQIQQSRPKPSTALDNGTSELESAAHSSNNLISNQANFDLAVNATWLNPFDYQVAKPFCDNISDDDQRTLCLVMSKSQPGYELDTQQCETWLNDLSDSSAPLKLSEALRTLREHHVPDALYWSGLFEVQRMACFHADASTQSCEKANQYYADFATEWTEKSAHLAMDYANIFFARQQQC